MIYLTMSQRRTKMATWIKITPVKDIPSMGSRKVVVDDLEIAIFKTKDGSVFAINNECPHKQGKLSEGLVHEHLVTCPLHNTDIALESGEAIGEDYSCATTYETKVEDKIVYIQL